MKINHCVSKNKSVSAADLLPHLFPFYFSVSFIGLTYVLL